MLRKLHRSGMSVARLNGSHNKPEWHAQTVKLLRKTVPDVPVLLDIPGRKIRTLQLVHEPSFKSGDIIILTTDISHDGREKVPVGYDRLHEKLSTGDGVFADDGTLSFVVDKIQGQDIYLRANMDGTLRSRKGINVPGIDLGQSLVTDKDRAMINFAKEIGVDYIGISFVESREHVEAIRALIAAPVPRIVAKVENSGGIRHLAEIVDAADVIMIDRGDLAVETSIDHVTLYQKQILEEASRAGKPTIVATEMLHSMIENPLPTKAEVSDITNAVLDGASAVMLSGETAVGRYPVEAVSRISRIAALASAERNTPSHPVRMSSDSDIRHTIRALAEALPLTRLVVLSRTGYSVRIAAMSGTGLPVLALGFHSELARSWNLLPNVESIATDSEYTFDWTGRSQLLEFLIKSGHVNKNDYIVILSAQQDIISLDGNIIQTVHVNTWLQHNLHISVEAEVA
ncbi:pyruvate kinase [Candidatus Pantoea deserta]|uniref:Pyruvate kinase n=2 Tax=Candidatus Pantoea deserta TaxID=1869313 RepID=A0A3N4NDP2_9GAMM|nr:pyruvate kinase [Pantoea deserta]